MRGREEESQPGGHTEERGGGRKGMSGVEEGAGRTAGPGKVARDAGQGENRRGTRWNLTISLYHVIPAELKDTVPHSGYLQGGAAVQKSSRGGIHTRVAQKGLKTESCKQ